MNSTVEGVLALQQVEWVRDYELRLSFTDGHAVVVDFAPFLRQAQHPAIQKYRDLDHFRQFRIEHGDLMWGDFDLVFPIDQLYAGQIS